MLETHVILQTRISEINAPGPRSIPCDRSTPEAFVVKEYIIHGRHSILRRNWSDIVKIVERFKAILVLDDHTRNVPTVTTLRSRRVLRREARWIGVLYIDEMQRLPFLSVNLPKAVAHKTIESDRKLVNVFNSMCNNNIAA